MEIRVRQRVSLSVFFFLSGVCFSSWASRIPTIKSNFNFNEAELGTLLLIMPISSLIGLPFSGWLVSRFDSRIPLASAFIALAFSMALIGFATTTFLLATGIALFAFSLRILNISMNTQALTLQKLFERKINGSFHGLWSTGGIAGVGFSTLLVGMNVNMGRHLLIISAITLIVTVITWRYLITNDRTTTGNRLKLGKPDPYIVYLGIIVFFSAICEGGMFDWSGVYFKEVVGEDLFTLGYLLFMIFMAFSRFASDYLLERIGMATSYMMCTILIVSGISLSVLFPTFWPALIGFCLVGFGTASIIPMTFLLAGNSQKYSAGMAISLISTYSIVGMLIGPAMIGYLAHAFGLRYAFITFGLAGFMLFPISQLFFRHVKGLAERK